MSNLRLRRDKANTRNVQFRKTLTQTIGLLLAALIGASVPAVASNEGITPGLYRDHAGRSLYVALDVEDDGPLVNWLDPKTQHAGIMKAAPGTWRLQKRVNEKRFIVQAPEGRLGVSLYYTDTKKRSTIILIHGNEDQTRAMGFVIPLFALNGINVISYDQRGNGESAGSWRSDGPKQRAVDIETIYDAVAANPLVDGKRIGLWAFSNGGWTAPIVALKRPAAFMILIGAPAETIADNIYFEIRERMRRDGFDEVAISEAVHAVGAYLEAAFGTGSWKRAQLLYTSAARQKWFADSGLRPHVQFPLPQERIDAIRRAAMYDPEPVLTQVKTPTLALFGALDRSVDASHAAPTLRADFERARMRDFTLKVYQNAGHSLVVSNTGYEDQPTQTWHLVPGYSQVMIDWLRKRRFLMPSLVAGEMVTPR